MNREELRDYIFNFWLDWGAFNYEERTDEEIKKEIYENLGTVEGTQKEMNFLNHEFEAGWSGDSLEYKELIKLRNYIIEYKENLGGAELVYKKGIFRVYYWLWRYRVYWKDEYGEHFDINFNTLESAKMYVDMWAKEF
jgi:hypothetical protein